MCYQEQKPDEREVFMQEKQKSKAKRKPNTYTTDREVMAKAHELFSKNHDVLLKMRSDGSISVGEVSYN